MHLNHSNRNSRVSWSIHSDSQNRHFYLFQLKLLSIGWDLGIEELLLSLVLKPEKESAAVLWGSLLHGGKSPPEFSPPFNTHNTSEHHLPWKRPSPPWTFTVLAIVLGCALCSFSGSGKDGLPKQVELMPWSFLVLFLVCCFSFFSLFVKDTNGFELLRSNNLKAVAQRKHAWLLLNTKEILITKAMQLDADSSWHDEAFDLS